MGASGGITGRSTVRSCHGSIHGVLRRTVVALLVIVTVAAVAVAAAGWYFSTLLTAESEPWQTRDKQVVSVEGDEVTLVLDEETRLPGRHALLWDDGLAQLGDQVSMDDDAGTVTYALGDVRGDLQAGLQVAWYAWFYEGAPAGLGLTFDEVIVPSPAGDLPAWYLPGESDTWVVAVHGVNGDREEALRALPTLVRAGLPTVVVRYRNDEGVPTEDGLLRLGSQEWQEVEAAMTWAKRRGADRFVLLGWSMGGAIVMQALDRAESGDLVDAVVLDSPLLDWTHTLHAQAADRGLPSWLADVAAQITEWRIGIEFDDFDWVARADEIGVPVLAFHGPDDTYVPWDPTRDLAAARPDVVTLVQVDEAGHTRSWNADPAAYDAELEAFLADTTG
jgi:alpha-beta hydrolase superfamily lysophospholipase